MSAAADHSFDMLPHVAEGLGMELLAQVASIGGATTWLLCTDDVTWIDLQVPTA